MKLLFFGDLDATGFGTVTMDLGRALLDKGVDVRFLSQNEFDILPEPFGSRTLSATSIVFEPDAENPQGAIQAMLSYMTDLLEGRATNRTLASGESWGDWKPDAALLLGDFYGVRLMAQPFLHAFARLPSYHYVPIEGHDLPPVWAEIWSTIKPIAMSAFGQREIARITGETPPLMYHGVDSETFRPVSTSNPLTLHSKSDGISRDYVLASRERCKAFFGIHPKARVVLRADRNMPRKNYPALLRSMDQVMVERDDVVLVLHCRSTDQGGFLHDSISKMAPAVRTRVMTPDWGSLPREALVALYNAADVYASASAEGFGLTIAEALACAVPAVGLDYSAVPEVIGPAGKTVPVRAVFDNEYAHRWAVPDEDAFSRTVAYLLDHPARARELGSLGPRHIAQNFTWAAAADVMAGLIGHEVRELVAA